MRDTVARRAERPTALFSTGKLPRRGMTDIIHVASDGDPQGESAGRAAEAVPAERIEHGKIDSCIPGNAVAPEPDCHRKKGRPRR
jgi:hypothetical protein